MILLANIVHVQNLCVSSTIALWNNSSEGCSLCEIYSFWLMKRIQIKLNFYFRVSIKVKKMKITWK